MKLTTEELRVGDVIEVWWKPGRDTITKLWPYTGPLKCLGRAMLAEFAINRTGMTLEEGGVFECVSRTGAVAM